MGQFLFNDVQVSCGKVAYIWHGDATVAGSEAHFDVGNNMKI